MKKILPAVIVLALISALGWWNGTHPTGFRPAGPAHDSSLPERDGREPRAGSQLQGEGTVVRVLSDDNEGSRHQRFIVRLSSGRTVLIAHNIDLAPRVEGLRAGDTVSFSGEFEDNDKGGVVHWTHHDPSGRHVAGWIRHDGRVYQ